MINQNLCVFKKPKWTEIIGYNPFHLVFFNFKMI